MKERTGWDPQGIELLTELLKFAGKGTQAPKIKEKFNCCHLVCQLDFPRRHSARSGRGIVVARRR